jgi:hypothetical protein
MEKLTKERAKLLEKLFNLSSDESTIICDINKKIEKYNQEEDKAKKEKESHEQTRKNLETELLSFSSQAKEFLSVFGRFNNSSFEKLKKIDIDLELGTVLNKVRQSVPNYEKDLNKDIKEQVNGITNCSKNIKDINHNREEAKKELGIAQEHKEKLADLLEDILVNNNISSYTRGYINKVLKEMDAFNQEEIKDLEFLILFPENGLKEYKEHPEKFTVEETKEEPKQEEVVEETKKITPEDIPEGEFVDLQKEKKNEKIGPSLKETMELRKSAKEEKKEKKNEKLGPSLQETMDLMRKEKEEKASDSSLQETMDSMNEELAADKETQEEETSEEAKEYVYEEEKVEEEPAEAYPEEKEEPVEEEKPAEEVEETTEEPEEPTEEVEKVVEEIKLEDEFNEELASIGIDPNAIDIHERTRVLKALQTANSKTLKSNYELLKSLDVDDDCLYMIDDNDYMYLTDTELNNKVTIIRGKGIKDSLIKNHLINNGLKMNVETLADRIKSITNTEKEFKESNLYMIEHDLINYEKNIAKLKEAGIELDAKETRNYMAILERCNNIDELINLITTYVINLSKKNGKYELNILLNNTKDLLFNLDDLMEQGLEDQISETPEVFDYNIDAILDRIKYSKDNSIPIQDDEDNTIKNYIYDGREFKDSYPDAKYNKLITREESNKALKDALNDAYTTELIETLDNYYKELKEYETLEANDKELYNELLKASEKELDINTIGKSTSKLKYVCISKNKLERNIAIIVNKEAKEKIEENKKLTILTAALYNLRIPEMEDLVEECK